MRSLVKESHQQPIIDPGPNPFPNQQISRGSSAHSGLTRNFTHDLIYFTEIGIGTPPQTFQVLVDISSPETFVTSIKCEKCAPGGVRYDSSKSRSSEKNGTVIMVDYEYVCASGNLTIDNFQFDEIQVKSQPFLEAASVQPVGFSWDDMSIIHGILGLTPSSAGSALRIHPPSCLWTGRYALTGRWQAEAHYMTLGSDPGIRISLAGYTASFSTKSTYMLLPDVLVMDIWHALQFEEMMFLPASIECDRRKLLPDLTFNLAGRNFTLGPNDYTFEWPLTRTDTRCVSAIMPFGVDQKDEIILGSAFLRAFYSVFDLDTHTIGFASLSLQA
ncbi:MAG: hypothetical protein Q9181_006249 [Wetmoreana brouardii]